MTHTFLLRAVAGSHAHGLATENSDYDLTGVYSVPSKDFWGLDPIQESLVGHDPDYSYHELRKFVNLCLKGNPTVIELLFADEYLDKEPRWGDELIQLKPYLLSAKAVKSSYLGYAEAQRKRMWERAEEGTPKYDKLLRHAFRLLDQGYDLYTSGTFELKASPARREFYLNIAKVLSPEEIEAAYEKRIKRFHDAVPRLRETPDRDAVVDWLKRYRLAHA